MHNIEVHTLYIFNTNVYLFHHPSKIRLRIACGPRTRGIFMNGIYNDEHNKNYGTDLACERRRANINIPGIIYRCEKAGSFTWERIDVTSAEGEMEIGRPKGSYDTLTTERMDILDDGEIEDAANEIAKELCLISEKTRVSPEKILVVGLGNERLTPDSVGPRSALRVNATMHLAENDPPLFRALECSQIAVISPGVMAKSGIEALDVVASVCDTVEPDLVIAIDSIASRSSDRLGKTIQISNTGIFPGSGIGNKRRPLSEKTLGIPVIAIGVPTVISAAAFSRDIEHEKRESDGLFVSPRDIDVIVDVSAKIISQGINQAFGIL